jgi:hypothetical protein
MADTLGALDGKLAGVNLDDRLKRLDADIRYFEAHREGWCREHPDKWIAVFEEQLISVAESESEIWADLQAKGIPLGQTIIDLLKPRPIGYLL